MPQEWAGESKRDLAVEAYVASLVLRGPADRAAAAPVTLLLGPRGSGKTTLLKHLAVWAERAPVTRLDLSELGSAGRQPVDVLAEAAFDLNKPKQSLKRFPRISFPTFAVMAVALAADIDARDRDTALRQMQETLSGPRRTRTEAGQQLAGLAASLMSLPSVVTAALPLLPLGERGWARAVTQARLWRLRRSGPGHGADAASARDFCVDLNHAYNGMDEEKRAVAERVLFDAFLDDLRRVYARGGRRGHTACPLVLLDNADSPLGGQVLRSLLEARERDGRRDPLAVLVTAGSYPETLQDVEFGWRHETGGYPGHWLPGDPFAPQEVAPGLCVGQLRDLTRAEVEKQAQEILDSAGAQPPDTDLALRWLSWQVHALTRGHPAGTTRVLAELLRFGRDVPWAERLRTVLGPGRGLGDELLTRLLPFGLADDLRQALVRASAAPDLAQALVTPELLDEAAAPLAEAFHAFCTDPYRTLHIDSGDPAADGPLETPHPLLRRLLLRALDRPEDAHAALRAQAEARGDTRLAVYHALAAGDLRAAAAHLDGLFERVTPEEWAAELCRLRHAPTYAALRGQSPDASPWDLYEGLVHHLSDPAIPPRLRTVTRLLAASWISPEPLGDPDTCRIGDPYHDTLADPYADLRSEIEARFQTLASAHTQRVAWTSLLRAKARLYQGEPWR